MKLIPLNTTRGRKGLFVQVDDEDYDFLMQWRWHSDKQPTGYYASRTRQKNEVYPTMDIRMHRVIMGITDHKTMIDHIDHNTQNNQRNNLRVATGKQNCQNRRPIKNSTSKFLGVRSVSDRPLRKKWRAQISPDKVCIHLGYFLLEEDAARAYDKKAKELYGEFANLNFK